MRENHFDVRDYPEIHALRSHWQAFAAESQNIEGLSDTRRSQEVWVHDAHHTQTFLDQIGDNSKWIIAWDNGGDWWNYPIILNDAIVPGRTRELCPRTCELLGRIEGIKVAGFSKLNAGGHIHPHYDTHGTPKCLAYHLGLRGRGELTASGHDEALVQEGGADFVIDTELSHSVVNASSDADRIILYVLFFKDRHESKQGT